jgi:hypothetical protein
VTSGFDEELYDRLSRERRAQTGRTDTRHDILDALALTFFDDLSQPAPKPWLIKNVIARGETSSWIAPPGRGKSALLTDISVHLASGCEWRGYRTKKPCGVVYFALERADLVKRRLIAHKLRDNLISLPIAVVSQVIDLMKGREIRVLDYIEGVGQEIGYYIAELRKRNYDQALLVLPHDGNAYHGPVHKTYKDHFQDAGFEVDVIPNQGAGAATLRVEAARRIFPRCWFNEKATQAGIEALSFYHERKDEARNIGLGPEHDWSSHAADAFGLMAVVYEEPPLKAFRPKRDDRPSGGTHWSA